MDYYYLLCSYKQVCRAVYNFEREGSMAAVVAGMVIQSTPVSFGAVGTPLLGSVQVLSRLPK